MCVRRHGQQGSRAGPGGRQSLEIPFEIWILVHDPAALSLLLWLDREDAEVER
jgi:hypothetical protein